MTRSFSLKSTFAQASLVLAALSSVANAQQGTRQYTIVNNCPVSADLYIAGDFQNTLAAGASVTKTLGTNAGFFYLFVNGATTIGTRAAFYGDVTGGYYYIVEDSSFFNTGLKITPSYPESGGFCAVDNCDAVNCANSLPQPPTRLPLVNATTGAPIAPPFFACLHPDVSFTMTFCPSGSLPSGPAPRAIHPFANANKCVDVRGANYANGTPVQIYDCNGTGAQKWVFNEQSTKIQVAGTNFCLDAGSNPASGVGMKIWQCYDNLPAQKWYKSPNGQLILDGTGFCLDLTDGVLTNSNQLQTWQCYDGNQNQLWTF